MVKTKEELLKLIPCLNDNSQVRWTDYNHKLIHYTGVDYIDSMNINSSFFIIIRDKLIDDKKLTDQEAIDYYNSINFNKDFIDKL